MKQRILLLILSMASFPWLSSAQVIKNGAFENWNSTNYDNSTGWFNSNQESLRRGGVLTVSKTSDSKSGNAVKIETKVVNGDTSLGFVSMTPGDPTDGQGGVPYTQKPDSITGWYKSNIATGDTGLLLVVFKKLGVVMGAEIFHFTGTHSSYTRFAFKVSPLLAPDTIVIAAASSNGINWVGVQPGSTLFLDELAFTGAGITQAIPNGNFDTWTSDQYLTLQEWEFFGENAKRTTDSYKGSYAVHLETVSFGGFDVGSSGMTNGHSNQGGNMGGDPYTGMSDTLIFWYKYLAQGNDSGQVNVMLMKNGSPIAGNNGYLPPATNYTMFTLPFSSGMAPDTIQIQVFSSVWPYDVSNVGSRLIIDEIQLASSRLNTGIGENSRDLIKAYPNPVSDKLFVTGQGYKVRMASIIDITGRVLDISSSANLGGTLSFDISSLSPGVYFYSITLENGMTASNKFIKQ